MKIAVNEICILLFFKYCVILSNTLTYKLTYRSQP